MLRNMGSALGSLVTRPFSSRVANGSDNRSDAKNDNNEVTSTAQREAYQREISAGVQGSMPSYSSTASTARKSKLPKEIIDQCVPMCVYCSCSFCRLVATVMIKCRSKVHRTHIPARFVCNRWDALIEAEAMYHRRQLMEDTKIERECLQATFHAYAQFLYVNVWVSCHRAPHFREVGSVTVKIIHFFFSMWAMEEKEMIVPLCFDHHPWEL